MTKNLLLNYRKNGTTYASSGTLPKDKNSINIYTGKLSPIPVSSELFLAQPMQRFGEMDLSLTWHVMTGKRIPNFVNISSGTEKTLPGSSSSAR